MASSCSFFQWEAGATSAPTPHNNWRRGQQKRCAPQGLVAPPSTPETYGVPSTKGRTQAARRSQKQADDDYVDDAADAAYTILGIGIYGLPAIHSMQDPNPTSSLSTFAAFMMQEATSSTGPPTLLSVREEIRSDANWRTGRKVITTEEF